MAENILPKQYDHTVYEQSLYQQWENSGAFTPDHANVDLSLEPFSILMPPPNANASLHAGHAMYVIQDILVRYHRMLGQPTVWFPGTDHAGFETQFVYEKHLKKSGKSRFDFDRETLYREIYQFVQDNSGLINDQMRRLGFSADWSQNTFMLDDKVIRIVLDTFQKLSKDGLIYRDNYLVNYCPKCGTTFADLEIQHQERVSPLYYVRYRFSDGEPRIINGQEMMYLVVATVRPETIFADAAVALSPEDPRAEALRGEYVINPLTRQPIPVIIDESVDPEFGTGFLKVTPAHDATDFEIGKRHHLPVNATINTLGKLDLGWWNPDKEPLISRATQLKEQFQNVSVFHGRPAVVKLLEAENALEKIDEKYLNQVTVCYKAGHDIEPLPYPNWFVKMQPLAQLGLEAVRSGQVNIIPKRFIKQYEQWLENIRDWPISRQIVWGIRMPVWYNAHQNPQILVTFLDQSGTRQNLSVGQALEQGHSLNDIRSGLQNLIAPMDSEYVISVESPGEEFIQETDVFDTWFSSGQWPLTVLNYPEGDTFRRFYPTSVMDTMWDILFFWVARMIMFGQYLTKDLLPESRRVPFKTVYLHSMVTDSKGTKMSKSKGNVINPLDIVEQYGADALRIALVAGSAPGNPIALSEPKVKGYRNFGNKLWNIGRFVQMQKLELGTVDSLGHVSGQLTESDQALLQQLQALTGSTTANLEALRFSDAAVSLYDFAWNTFANGYLEENKNRPDKRVYLAVVNHTLSTLLILLHPFMPFVTEAIWQHLRSEAGPLITTPWPNV